MPELAEVVFFSKKWSPLLGQPIESVSLRKQTRVFRGSSTHALERELKGQRLTHILTHGKQMAFRFSGHSWLGVHLGMAGELHFMPGKQEAEKHDHLILQSPAGRAVFRDYRHFGRIRFDTVRADELPDWWSNLPAPVTSPDFSPTEITAFFARRARAPIKAVLLMQERFPGLGNWMVDEILWRSRIYPATLAGKIGPRKITELHRTIVEVTEDALRVIGADWSDPPDTWLFNHRWKDGGTCPATRKPLKRAQIGGRTTCWSPAHQTYRGH